jgi:AAA+ superfamily predicted ATPase
MGFRVTKPLSDTSKLPSASRNLSEDIYQTSLDHILDELARIDLIIRNQVKKWRQYGKNTDFLGLYVSEEEIDSLLEPERPEVGDMSEIKAFEMKIAERKTASLQRGVELKLELLRCLFDLSALEVDAVLVALACELDSKYSKLFAYLQDDVTKKKPTIGLFLELFCKSKQEAIDARRHFGYNSPLVKNLVFHLEDSAVPLLEKGVKLDDRILGFLLGSNELDSTVASFALLKKPEKDFDELFLSEEIKNKLLKLNDSNSALKPLLLLHGSYGMAEFAEAFCGAINVSLLVADLGKLKAESLGVTIKLLLREARLQRAAVYFDRFDDASEETKAFLLEEIETHDGVVFVPSKMEFCLKKTTIKVVIPNPNYSARLRMWQSLLGEFEGISELAAKFRFSRKKAAAALESARNNALLRNPDDPSVTLDDLYEGCRAQSGSIPFTSKVPPRYTWTDIVLPADKMEQLREICNYVKHNATVFEAWGFEKHSRGKGLNVLFSGPSGTGKTMAAEIVAHELRLDMYKIDLSMVVSKYIGETEKNLNRIFKDAEECNAVLFFDEADALFGKRSEVKDAHDRYANVEINYLLQKMEEHEGIAILATNMSKNIDDAFLRRMNFIVEFPFPNEEYRRVIWRKVFPEQAPLGEIDFDFLSRLQISGGNIKNIALTAAFLAAESSAKVKMEHVVKAAKREFQKTGKVYGKEEFGKYYDYIK